MNDQQRAALREALAQPQEPQCRKVIDEWGTYSCDCVDGRCVVPPPPPEPPPPRVMREGVEVVRIPFDNKLQQPQCNPHPDAPHGFDRNASHSADRYVCECESWEQPQDNLNCKSVQARLATSWGYVKAQPQDHSEQHLNMVQGEWVDLTDDEVDNISGYMCAVPEEDDWVDFAQQVITVFKMKNTQPSVEAAIEAERERIAEWLDGNFMSAREYAEELRRGIK